MARVMALVCVADRLRARSFYSEILGPIFGIAAPGIDQFGDQFPCGEGFIRLTTIPGWQAGQYPVLGWQVDDALAAARALTDAGVPLLRYPGLDQDDLGLWHAPDGGAVIGWFNDSEGNLLSLAQQG
jgi:hypothetical protein